MDIEGDLANLIDDKDFQSIDARMARFNIFEAVGSVRGELRHSNFLGFLLSPGRNHGLGSTPLLSILRTILAKMPGPRPIRALQLVVGDLDGAVVYRERFNIDLLIEIRPLNLVVAIENKIDAQAGNDQLAGYRRTVESHYAGWRQLLVFLTPDGREPDDSNYVAFSYVELAKTLETFLDSTTREPAREIALVLQQYIEMLRRHIVADEELRNLAQQLYERHKEAFDFVFQSRPVADTLLDVVTPHMRALDGAVEDKHTDSLLRFRPLSWDAASILASDPKFWTKSGRGVLFEIKYFSDPVRMIVSLLVGPGEAEVREHFYNSAAARGGLFRGLVKPMGKQWSTIYSRELLPAVAAKDMSVEQKQAVIVDAWKIFANDDYPKLEQAMLEIAAIAP